MIDWERCETHEERFFAWREVRAAWDAIDWAVARISFPFAKDELGDRACACPTCGCAPDRLEWFSIGTSDAAWFAGDQRCGWIILCASCARQVAFILDEEMTQSRRDGNW